jgi:hypothetical protein
MKPKNGGILKLKDFSGKKYLYKHIPILLSLRHPGVSEKFLILRSEVKANGIQFNHL